MSQYLPQLFFAGLGILTAAQLLRHIRILLGLAAPSDEQQERLNAYQDERDRRGGLVDG